MKIAYQKYPLVGNYTHPWVLLTIIIKILILGYCVTYRKLDSSK